MNLKEHKKFLATLIESNEQAKRLSGHIGRAVPKCEGAFFFGHAIDMDEYIVKYTAEIDKLEASEVAEESELEEVEEDEY